MFITTHTVIGVILGQQVEKPILAFILGLVSHYLIDIIPHGDQSFTESKKWGVLRKVYFSAAAVDLLCFIFFLYLLYSKIDIFTPSILAAVLGSIIPDFLTGFYNLIKKYFKESQSFFPRLVLNHAGPFFKKHDRFHLWIHNLLKFQVPIALAIFLQIIFITFFYIGI